MHSHEDRRLLLGEFKRGQGPDVPSLMQQTVIRTNACGQNVNWPQNSPPHICVLLERILDFNGLLESAQPSLKLQLKPDYQIWTQAKLTLDTFTAACQYNLQTAWRRYPVLTLKQLLKNKPWKALSEILKFCGKKLLSQVKCLVCRRCHISLKALGGTQPEWVNKNKRECSSYKNVTHSQT